MDIWAQDDQHNDEGAWIQGPLIDGKKHPFGCFHFWFTFKVIRCPRVLSNYTKKFYSQWFPNFFSIQTLFQNLDELSVKGQNVMGSDKTFWKITKHDEHSIPEGRWLEGQVEVRSQDGGNYWVSILLTMQRA